MLTQTRLKEVLNYNPKTGIFIRKTYASSNAPKGDVAGGISHRLGYHRINVDNESYLSHRLAWLYIHGYFPEHGLDHINRNVADNRIANLREAGKQCNARNYGNPKNNTSGVKGVFWHSQRYKWGAQIVINHKRKSLGLYNVFDNAVCARLAAEQCVGWNGCDSSSPAYQYVKELIRSL